MGFDPNQMAACTMLFEGDAAWVKSAHTTVVAIAKKFGGMVGGPENGKRGYLLTFLITYIRDVGMKHNTLAESFELSCPWTSVSTICRKIRQRTYDEAAAQGFPPKRVWVSFRVTQIYETGAAVYVYMTLEH